MSRHIAILGRARTDKAPRQRPSEQSPAWRLALFQGHEADADDAIIGSNHRRFIRRLRWIPSEKPNRDSGSLCCRDGMETVVHDIRLARDQLGGGSPFGWVGLISADGGKNSWS